MKKIFSAAAVTALVLTAGHGFAGSKYMPPPVQQGCPGDCQDQIDGLNSSQARQDEQIRGLQGDQIRQDGELNALRADQSRQDNDINSFRSGQIRQDGELDALRADQIRQDGEIRANAAGVQKNMADINALKNSTSNKKDEDCNPWYVKGIGRVLWTGSMDLDKAEYGYNGDTDTGYGVGLAVGRQFGNFRAEGELAVQKADFKADGLSDVRIDTAMFNGFYEIPLSGFAIPWTGGLRYDGLSIYGMAGIGPAKVEVFFDNDRDDSETTFAYKAGMGLAFDVAVNMKVDLGYEYLRTSDIELGHDHELLRADDLKNSSFTAALRYVF